MSENNLTLITTLTTLIKQFNFNNLTVIKQHNFYHISTLIIHTNTHLRKLEDSIYHLLHKQILQLLLTYEALVFYLKEDYHLN